MEGDALVGLLNELLWNAMLVAGPVLFATLAVGLCISVVQVATQLQETTLSYVPKLFVSAVLIILVGAWMMHQIGQFAVKMIALIPSLG